MKKIIALFAVILTGFILISCQGNIDVGVAMPTSTSTRWVDDGNSIEKELKAKGYKVLVKMGENEPTEQVKQVEAMLARNAKVLIIAAIDATVFVDVLKTAKEKGVKVISYDRLLMNTENVDYYVTFDNEKVGEAQASSLVKGLEEKHGKLSKDKPLNIELFAGSSDDNNVVFNYRGAMKILEPHLDSGALVVKSGQIARDKVMTERWDGAKAQSRLEGILSAHYTGDNILHGILSQYDGMSYGVLAAVTGAGYKLNDPTKPIPIITGQDSEVQAIENIIKGEQYSTLFKDTRLLGRKAVEVAQALLKGETVTANDTETYDTGKKKVPTVVLDLITIDKNNWKKELVESGYYAEGRIKEN